MMNLAAWKTSPADLKSIDLATLVRTLKRRKDLMANLALILFVFFLIYQIYTNRRAEVMTFKNKISDLEKKNEAISHHEKMVKELDEFIKALPQGIQPFAIIEKLNDLAEKNKIQIISVSPAQSRSEELYEKTSVNMNISAGRYEDILHFIYDIERFPYNLRVDQWSGYQIESNSPALTGDSSERSLKETISAQIEINAIYFKK